MYQKQISAAQNGRPMGEHVQQCMTWRKCLKALGAYLPHELFVQLLLEVDDEYMFTHHRFPCLKSRLWQSRWSNTACSSSVSSSARPGWHLPVAATPGTNGFAARVHRLWPPSEEGESSARATTARRSGICMTSALTYKPEVRKYLALGFGRGGGAERRGGPGRGNGG